VLAAYVSGHGFGHATRTSEVLKALRRREPGLALAVMTSGPEALYRGAVPGELGFRRVDCDVGLAQKDALRIDEEGTAAACRAFAAGFDERVGAEASWLRSSGARLVVGDIPPLAFAAAAEAGIPSVGIANFSWDWVYRGMSARHPSLLEAADAARDAYRRADLLLRLPFAGDLSAFPRIEELPLIARRPDVERGDARRRLVLDGRPAVLLSFGGVGLPGFDPSALAPLRDLQFLSVGEWPAAPANLRSFEPARLQALGLGYEDLVGAADVVVTKPGYGIVTDAIGAAPGSSTGAATLPSIRSWWRMSARASVRLNGDLMAGRLLSRSGGRRNAVSRRPDMSGADGARRLPELMEGVLIPSASA
jgi:L-arabinokinase